MSLHASGGKRLSSIFPQDKEPHKYVISRNPGLAARFHPMDLSGACHACGKIMPPDTEACTRNSGGDWGILSRGGRWVVYRRAINKEKEDGTIESYYLYLYMDLHTK